VDAPCCIAVNSPTNKCGGSNGNVRIVISSLNDFDTFDSILIFSVITSCVQDQEIFRAMESIFAVLQQSLLLRLKQYCSVFAIVSIAVASIAVASHNNTNHHI
jgi:hypothetical protein